MRLSCNGCRVLRQGCSESCVLRPCLEWIRSPESQANATAFLAEFYGRTALINLICNGPEHLRPDFRERSCLPSMWNSLDGSILGESSKIKFKKSAMFKSLLYDACGRMLDPIFGSVGFVQSGNWEVCEAGVESILRGNSPSHVDPMEAMARELHRVKAKDRFKNVSRAKPRRKQRKSELLSNQIVSSSKSDSWCNVANGLHGPADNGKSTKEPEQNEFVSSDQAKMQCCNNLIWNLETSEPEAEAPCNDLMPELTLGYQGPTSPTRILLTDSLGYNEAHSNQRMEKHWQ